jgi:aspartyl-tRNA(Asn)/glutamyl-tRNA(Gln) amidotransferase subunit A
MTPTLTSWQRAARATSSRPQFEALLEAALVGVDAPAARHVFTQLDLAGARAAARLADTQAAAGLPLPVLAGLPVTVKDLFDVGGSTTLAGSTLRQGQPASCVAAG